MESALSLPSRICARLYPSSDAACHAASLPFNTTHVEKLDRRQTQGRLPSPATSADEDPEVEDVQDSATETASEAIVVLQQDARLHCFDLGSALENYFVLDSGPFRSCYVNIVHCQFFPDPESSDLWLRNRSTTKLSIEGRSPASDKIILDHGDSAPMGPGIWDIALGDGWLFSADVLARSPAASSSAVHATSDQDSLKSAKAKKPARGPRTSKDQLPLDKTRKASFQHPNSATRVEQVPLQSTAVPGGDVLGKRRLFQTIDETANSVVRKRITNGITTAIKSCRRANVPEAADMWKREVDMLLLLGKHV